MLAVFPSLLDRVSHFLRIYYAPTTLFLVAIGFLLLVCIYFSYELSRLEERTRVLAEELAILRSEQERPATTTRRPAHAVAQPHAVRASMRSPSGGAGAWIAKRRSTRSNMRLRLIHCSRDFHGPRSGRFWNGSPGSKSYGWQ